MGANFPIGIFSPQIIPRGGAASKGISLENGPSKAARMPD
jgi:hypothetical protein